MKVFILFFAIALCATHIYSQENDNPEPRNNEFGIHAGTSTGLGLSYRHWFNKPGLQITLLPIISDDYTFVSAALTGLYSFKETKYARVYGYLGNHIIYNSDTSDPVTYNIGLGPAFSFGSTVAFNLMFGYGMYDILNSFNLLPTIEGGLYFKF
ncbi:MAG: hypothetical protein JW894_00940 [Bacteroidales bacterium]|nr:hypothetical protein [Bacteroidales bacterium]